MRASKRLRNVRPDGDHSVLRVVSCPEVPTDTEFDIPNGGWTLEFSGAIRGPAASHAP